MGEAIKWENKNYFYDGIDTIWFDRECYDEWCACIDECSPGLCCKFLQKNEK